MLSSLSSLPRSSFLHVTAVRRLSSKPSTATATARGGFRTIGAVPLVGSPWASTPRSSGNGSILRNRDEGHLAISKPSNQFRFYSATAVASSSSFPAPRLFDYATVTKNLSVSDAIDAVEQAFAALAKGEVDVPMPMHIGIHETSTAGPGDCHIKGGYVLGSKTFTVKLACVSFYKNLEKGLPAGSGVFIVVDAVTGAPLAVMQENRFMTDLRTGAAGAVAVKYTTRPTEPLTVGFIGCGAIARTMARATQAVRPGYKGVAYGLVGAEEFCADMKTELGLDFVVASSAQQLCQQSNVIFTQTTGSSTIVELPWLQPGTTIIASGSDQPTKQEIPNDVLKASKYISDLTKQTSKVGELRGPLQAGVMTLDDVHAELGEVVNGTKSGRVGDELIVVDLTGTGAQDAAIGQVAWDKLSAL
jgi:ornithine cyclodeaminase/alanine dehydrogenase-like protein (mu-crystallin family)